MGLTAILAGAAQVATLLQQGRTLINELVDQYAQVKDTLSSDDQAKVESALADLKTENAQLFSEFDAKLEKAKNT